MKGKNDFSEISVLVIDDERFMLDVIVRALRGLGVRQVIRADNCDEARETIARDRLEVDCLVVDFNMKPENGLQFLQSIRTGREERIARKQTFIMLTGNARSEVVTASIALDVNAYLVKPVAAVKLGEALKRAISTTWELKDAAHYARINVGVTEAYNDAAEKGRAQLQISPDEVIKRASHEASFIDREKKITADVAPSVTENANSEREPIVSIRRCSLAKLREKMVIGEDIQAEDGTVLISKGTVLTNRMVERLRTIAEDRKFVLIERAR